MNNRKNRPIVSSGSEARSTTSLLHAMKSSSTGGPVSVMNIPPGVVQSTPKYGLYRYLHEEAIRIGAAAYQDPITNELVATSSFLEKRGAEACVHHEQRHCPHLGQLHPVGKEAANITAHHALGSSDDSSVEDATSSSGVDDDVVDCDEEVHHHGANNDMSDFRHRRKVALRRLARQVPVLHIGQLEVSPEAQPLTTSSKMSGKAKERGPSPFTRRQTRPLKLAELPDAEDIMKLPHYAQIGRMHHAAEEQGLDAYRDPSNGCIFYTRAFLAGRPCCGEECRHCPYGRVGCRQKPSGHGSSDSSSSTSSAESHATGSSSSSSSDGSEGDEGPVVTN